MFIGIPMLPLAGGLTGASALLTACGGGNSALVASSATLNSVSFSSMPAPTLANAAAMATPTVGSVMSANFSDASKVDFK